MLIVSDVHFDSVKCDRELLKKHLDEIKKEDGIILIIGDLFDVMGTFQDPRSKPQDIRSEYYVRGRGYLDLIVEDAVNFFKPYADNIKLIGYGNHETNITRRHDTDIIDRFAYLLHGNVEAKGAYQGFFGVKLSYNKNGSQSSTYNIAYHHGHGGARRSKGVLNSQLDAMKYPDANLIVSGHDHNKIHDPSNVRFTLDYNRKVVKKTCHWLKLGSYKKTSLDFGYEVQGGYFPSRLGGWFCELQLKKPVIDGKRPLIINERIYEAN
jgi:hypothetical protein